MEGIFYSLEECPTTRNAILLVGLLYLSWIALSLIRLLWSGTKAYILSGLFSVRIKPSLYGWAVITGASDGIGKEYAIQLAKCGMNVVLVSRSFDKLKAVEKEILDQYSVSVKIVVMDFADAANIYNKIEAELSGLEIGILINNVGVSYEYPDFFHNVPEDRLWQLINVNMASVIMMTKMILPDMLDKKRGIVVNISSTSALNPTALLGVYSASKIFVDYFTAALQYEYAGKGVIIQSVLPGFVATNMSGIQKTSFMVPGPRKYVQDALATIGVQSKTFGTMSHALQGWLLQALPQWLVMTIIYKSVDSMRKVLIAKKQKKQ